MLQFFIRTSHEHLVLNDFFFWALNDLKGNTNNNKKNPDNL